MSSVAENKLRNAGSIAVFRALVLGDLLCAIPAFRALREGCPQAKITLIGLAWAQSFARRFSHLIDDFLPFPGFPGLPETVPDIHQIPSYFQKAQACDFDVSLQMHGSGAYVNSISVLLGAKRTAGFYLHGEYCPDPDLFTFSPSEGHEIHKLLELTGFLGLPSKGDELEFPLLAEDEKDYQQLQGIEELKGNYVCIHAGSRLLSRRWLPERFAAAADAFSTLGLQVVLTGSVQEKTLVEGISHQIKAPHLNLAGKTTLGALAMLLSKSQLLVTNDTGISHVAAGLKVPSVVIVTGSDFKRWRPLNTQLHKTVYAVVDCRPCMYDLCPIGQPCAHQVQVRDVLNAARELLAAPQTDLERETICVD